MIGRQIEKVSRFFTIARSERLLPIRQLAIQFSTLQMLALPEGEVGILQWQCRQLRRVTARQSAITLGEFANGQRSRPCIGDQVVQRNGKNGALFAKVQQLRAQQRWVLEIEWLSEELRQPFLDGGLLRGFIVLR